MVRSALVVFLLFVAPMGAFAGSNESGIEYRFENEQFRVSKIEMEVGMDGTGRLVFVRKGLTKPVERTLRVSDDAMAHLWESLGRIEFLSSQEDYQSKQDHANLGLTTIQVCRDGKSREVSFNYTSNREMWTFATVLRGIANREIYAFDLETALRFQPLETPALLDAFKKDLAGGRVSDPVTILPLLRQISEDFALPLIARNRAGELVAEIEKRAKK